MNFLVVDDSRTMRRIVNNLESVHGRLSDLIERFKIKGADLVSEMVKVEKHSFDPDAAYDRSASRQRSVDEIIQHASALKLNPGDLSQRGTPNPASQDEIDKLFGNGA
ncbi:MAG TPA: hypothetical protein VIS48_05565 [Candidatus Kryptonia bacterium]